MSLLPDPEDGDGLFGEGGSESGLFDQAPATLPRGFEISETEQSGNYEGVLYRRDSRMDGFDDVVRVQEIDGRNEVYAGVDDGDEANLNPTYFEDPDQFDDPFELAARTAEGTFDPLNDSGGVGGIEENIAAAERAGALSPDPNGDAQQAPDDLFAPSNGGRDTPGKRKVDVQSLDSAGEIRGHQEAIDALVFEAGWDRAEAEALGQQVEDPTSSMTEPEFQRIVDTEIKRSRSSGRFAAAPTQDGPPGVDRRRSSGRFISSPLADTNIRRYSRTGRFTRGGSE